MTEARLSDNPDWGYLLCEFYELYRFLPSGGSVPICAYQRVVREAISRTISIESLCRIGIPRFWPGHGLGMKRNWRGKNGVQPQA